MVQPQAGELGYGRFTFIWLSRCYCTKAQCIPQELYSLCVPSLVISTLVITVFVIIFFPVPSWLLVLTLHLTSCTHLFVKHQI